MDTATPDTLLKTLVDLKWKDGFACRKCGNKLYKAGTKTEGGRKCKGCDTEESLKRYTVFDNSKIPLSKAYEMMDYLVMTCRSDENEKWFKAGSLAEDYEKHQFEQRLTLSEFVERMSDRIEIVKVKIDNLDATMEKWFADVDKNIDFYKQKYKTRAEFNEAKLFKPLEIMVTKQAELEENITHPEFLDRANKSRHRLQLLLEGKESSLERRAQKYFRTKKPTIAYLAKKFELEENTIRAFMKKIHERLKCFNFFDSTGNDEHYDDVAEFLKDTTYDIGDYFGLFMYPLTEPLINGETCIDYKWYKLNYHETQWSLWQIHFVSSNDIDGNKVTYYNKPGEEEYICSDPDSYEGSVAEYPYQ